MKLTLDNPATVAAPFGDRFSHVARLDLGDGALLILSGQVAVDDDGAVVAPGDAAAQAGRIFELIGGLLTAHGAAFADVLHVRTFMTSLDDSPATAGSGTATSPGPSPPAPRSRSAGCSCPARCWRWRRPPRCRTAADGPVAPVTFARRPCQPGRPAHRDR